MRTTPRLLAAVLALTAAPVTQAAVVEASSTTLATAGQQTRGGLAGQKPDLVNVSPVFELVSVTARGVENPVFDNLDLVLSGWGSYDLAEPRWDSGTSDKFTGDLTIGYVKGQLFKRAVTVRAGREYVSAGAGQMLQLDGGDVVIRLPAGISVSGFGGIPVAQRFQTRAGAKSWNPAGGDLAYGGRVGLTVPFAGTFGRALDIGASAVFVSDNGDAVRQDAGLDFRLSPVTGLVFAGHGVYSLYAGRLADADVLALWDLNAKTFVTVDFRYTSPDLFLARNSILSVFTASTRKDVGGGFRYRLTEAFSAGADVHALLEPGVEEGKTDVGTDAALKCEYEQHGTTAGAELTYLKTGEKGYTGVRAYGRKDLGAFFVSGDVSGYAFKAEVNGQKSAVQGTLAAGYQIAPRWSAVLAGRAGVNPFLEQQADVMVKLVYAQTASKGVK